MFDFKGVKWQASNYHLELFQDLWAICRIFKKTNSVAQRALSHSWVSPEAMTTTPPDHHLLSLPNFTHHHAVPFVSDHIITQLPPPPTASHLISNAMINAHLPPLDSFKPCPSTGFSFFSPLIDNMQVNMPPAAAATKCTAMDVTSMLLNLGNSVDFGQQNNNSDQFAVNHHHLQSLEAASSTGLSFTLPAMFNSEEWKPLSLPCSNYNNSSSSNKSSSAYI